ncbi:MAG: dockerin type I repeat-containing protein, partial [Oscillospiraceae bacterium]|nr:dockerin type I repeat-containing protein [Oscillospiraceae bacterium]
MNVRKTMAGLLAAVLVSGTAGSYGLPPGMTANAVELTPQQTTVRTTKEADPNVLYGDVNQDGEVNTIDFAYYVEMLLQGEVLDLEAADVNLDGYMNFMDCDALDAFLLGLGEVESLPVTGSAEGFLTNPPEWSIGEFVYDSDYYLDNVFNTTVSLNGWGESLDGVVAGRIELSCGSYHTISLEDITCYYHEDEYMHFDYDKNTGRFCIYPFDGEGERIDLDQIYLEVSFATESERAELFVTDSYCGNMYGECLYIDPVNGGVPIYQNTTTYPTTTSYTTTTTTESTTSTETTTSTTVEPGIICGD